MADWGSPISGASWEIAPAAAFCTPSTTAHTKGSYAVIGTVPKSGAIGFGLSWGGTQAHRTLLFDVAIGSSGQEKIILADFGVALSGVGSTASRSHSQEIRLPITLPENSILSARCQGSLASTSGIFPSICSQYNTPCYWTGSVIDTYGAVTGSSAGTTLTAPNTDFGFGSYTELTASCSRMECFFIALFPRAAQTAFADQDSVWELAVGGAGDEKTIASGSAGTNSATGILHPQWVGPFYQQIANGQRLSARLGRQVASSSQRTLDIIVYGVR